MRPPKPLPASRPFLTLFTTAFRRPQALARNFASVARQTAVEAIEQIVIPDHVGLGWDAMFGRASWYAEAARGEYVVWLNDDDALADERVVERLRSAAGARPEVLLVRVAKGDQVFPKSLGRPIEGDIDLGSYVLRADIWRRHASDYGHRYSGDYDHAAVLWAAGYEHEYVDILFACGPSGGGRPEVDW